MAEKPKKLKVKKMAAVPKFIITKDSRNGLVPYAGPTCLKAGVPLAKKYESEDDAKADAAKLTQANPAGFSVWPA